MIWTDVSTSSDNLQKCIDVCKLNEFKARVVDFDHDRRFNMNMRYGT